MVPDISLRLVFIPNSLPFRLCLLILFLSGTIATTAEADTLILKNGDRLTGVVINETDGVLKFKTSYAGVLSIKWLEVEELRSDSPMTLLLDDNDVLLGNVVTNSGDTLQIENKDQPDVTELYKQSVKQINPEPWLLGKGHKLSGMINISLKYDRGNNVNNEIDFDGKLEYRDLRNRLSIYGEYDEDITKEITTKQKWLLTGAYDYFPRNDWGYLFGAQDWFVGLGLNLKSDKFSELNLRTRFGPHIGYQFYESKVLNFFLQGGGEAVKENFSTQQDNRYWATTWRLNFDRYLFNESLQLYFISDGLYGFASPDKTLLENWAGFRFPLKGGVIAAMEAETDYDSQPAVSVKKLSTTYRFKLGYEF